MDLLFCRCKIYKSVDLVVDLIVVFFFLVVVIRVGIMILRSVLFKGFGYICVMCLRDVRVIVLMLFELFCNICKRSSENV